MPIKEIVCLAFSRKMGGSCFAGLELVTGSWIRAIGKYEAGALADIDCYMQVNDDPYRLPALLDVIAIEFDGAKPTLAQPENWRVSSAEWRWLRKADGEDLKTVRDAISDDRELFRGYERYVSTEVILSNPPRSSLALVRPETLWWRPKIGKHGRYGLKGAFTYSGYTYELPLTDDAAMAKLSTGRMGNGLTDVEVDVLLTISLGEVDKEWGRHYKLIAAVIELPRVHI